MQRLAASADLTETKNKSCWGNILGHYFWYLVHDSTYLSISANQIEFKQIGWLGKTFDVYDGQQSRIVRITRYRISQA